MRGHKVITISYFHVAVPKTLTALNPARFITKPFFRYLSTCQQQQHYKAHPWLQLLLLVQLILRCCREAARQNFFQEVFMVRPRISVHQPGWFINRSVFFLFNCSFKRKLLWYSLVLWSTRTKRTQQGEQNQSITENPFQREDFHKPLLHSFHF